MRLEPVVLDDPAPDLALARARAAGEERRAVEDDGEPPAALLGALQLADHVLEEEERAVVDARQAGPEATAEAELVVLVLDLALDLLPLDAERRVGEEVVVASALEGVLAEAVAETDVRRLLALQHHVASGRWRRSRRSAPGRSPRAARPGSARAGSPQRPRASRPCRRPGRASSARCPAVRRPRRPR